MNRPKIKAVEAKRIAEHFYPDGVPEVLLIGVRGYFLNSIGKPGVNDFNRWDDAMLVLEKGELAKTFNANTDPTKLFADVAMLKTGIYKFYKGRHKNRIDALRAYPEGVKWECERQGKNGKWYDSVCSHINIHDGGLNDTWSAGCQTLPNYAGNRQFNEFRDLVYKLMSASKMKTVDYLLLTEDEMSRILNEKAAVDLSIPPAVEVAGNTDNTDVSTAQLAKTEDPEPEADGDFLGKAFDKNVSADEIRSVAKTALPSFGVRLWRFLARPLIWIYAALEAGNIAAWLGIVVVAGIIVYLLYRNRKEIKKLWEKLKSKITS